METLISRHAPRRASAVADGLFAFTITTILTLALGIGATTSIFTSAHAVLLETAGGETG